MVEGSATMERPLTRHKFTVDEYHRMGEAGIFGENDRVELLHGEVVVMTPIGPPHAGTVRRLNRAFRPLEPQALLSIQSPIRFEDSEPEPDFALLTSREDLYDHRHPGPGDVHLVVEVADTSLGKDRGVKADLYAAGGIPEYWLLDLGANRIEVRRDPEEGGYRTLRTAERGEALTPLAFPDFEVRVEALLP